MNRALPLLLLAALAGGGLAYFALMNPAPGNGSTDIADVEGNPNPRPKAAPKTADQAPLVDVGERPSARPKAILTGQAKMWRVFPMNQRGQALAEASIVAVHDGTGEERTSKGRTTWKGIDAGNWTVSIEAEGFPNWVRNVELAQGEAQTTAARLGNEVRISGTVVDSYGSPIGKTAIYLLPKGERHPSAPLPKTAAPKQYQNDTSKLDKGRTTPKKASPPPVKQVNNGPIAAQTNSNGTFKAVLPDAGEWRVSVGKPGDARWTQTKPMDITHGGPDLLHVVVPSLSSLELRYDGEGDEVPTQVTCYHYDSEFAARMLQEGQRSDDSEGKFDDPYQRKKLIEEGRQKGNRGAAGGDGAEKQKSAKGADGGRPGSDNGSNRANFERNSADGEAAGSEFNAGIRAPLFETGWRPVASARFDGDGMANLSDLPHNDALRFLFIRKRERITTINSTTLTRGKRSVGIVSLPRPQPEQATMSRSELGSISASVVNDEDAPQTKPGVTLTTKD